MDRRTYLTAAATVASGFAGCGSVLSASGSLDLAIFNQTPQAYTVYLAVLKADGAGTLNDASVYEATLEIGADGERRRDAVAEIGRYIVRYDVYDGDGRRTDQDHAHYYPPDGGGDGSIAFDIVADGTVTRRQLR